MSAHQYLSVSVHDGIAQVVLDRPPVNAVNQEMYREIHDLFSTIAWNDGVQAVVLSGPRQALLWWERPR